MLWHALDPFIAMSSVVQGLLHTEHEVSLVKHLRRRLQAPLNLRTLVDLIALAFALVFALAFILYAKPNRRSYLLIAFARCSRSCCMILRASVWTAFLDLYNLLLEDGLLFD